MNKRGERCLAEKEHILAAKDCASTYKVVLPAIIAFEAIMIVVQLVGAQENYVSSDARALYLASYVTLLVTSSVVLAYVWLCDAETHARSLRIISYVYAVLLFVWALAVTLIDATEGYESPLIYGCALLLFPVVCSMDSKHVVALEIVGDVAMLAICFAFYTDQVTFFVNFVAYAAIALLVGLSYRNVRNRGYKKQVELEALSDIRWQYANMDELTGLLNRRAYVNKLEELQGRPRAKSLTVWSFDVNYLKKTNDEQGHAAGDELLRCAAKCLSDTFGEVASVYRIGGDEFAAIDPSGTPREIVCSRLEDACRDVRTDSVDTLSIAVGCASVADHPGMSLFEIERAADSAMYEDKARHHISRV